MDFKLIDVEISSSIVFIYFTVICGEKKTMRYEVAVVCRGRFDFLTLYLLCYTHNGDASTQALTKLCLSMY